MGVRTVAIYAEADRHAPHVAHADVSVSLGAGASTDTYLCSEKIVAACLAHGVDAVHPGYGFLSENAEFAQAIEDAGMRFVGPSPGVIAEMGDKLSARRLADSCGVPTVPGSPAPIETAEAAQAIAAEIGYPVLIKAAAGGGGKGMQVVRDAAEFPTALAATQNVAARAFGDARVFIERFLDAPRHIEIQVLADGQGGVAILGERDCTWQRRHQKIIEEAPAIFISAAMRAEMHRVSRDLAEQTGYRSAGTIEYIVDGQGEEFFFLEVNTRLQVEHPVTEEIFGVDLVEWMLRIADGQQLPSGWAPVAQGHSFEARLYAEDPARGSLPSTGVVTRLRVPECRWEGGVTEGMTITPHFDPMIAKVITHAASREEARLALLKALEALSVRGVITNRGLLIDMLKQPAMLDGSFSTSSFGELYPDSYVPMDIAIDTRAKMTPEHVATGTFPFAEGWWLCSMAAYALAAEEFHAPSSECDEWFDLGLFLPESDPSIPQRVTRHRLRREGDWITVTHDLPTGTDVLRFSATVEKTYRTVCLRVDTEVADAPGNLKYLVSPDETYWVHYTPMAAGTELVWQNRRIFVQVLPFAAAEVAAILPMRVRQTVAGEVQSPMPGMVVRLDVSEGDSVEIGDTLLVLEAMKMENPVLATSAGTVTQLGVSAGEAVEAEQVLMTIV